jgi:hypothetical protein
VARRGPSLELLMAAGAMISPHKRAWSNWDPAAKAQGKEHTRALHGKARHEVGSRRGASGHIVGAERPGARRPVGGMAKTIWQSFSLIQLFWEFYQTGLELHN